MAPGRQPLEAAPRRYAFGRVVARAHLAQHAHRIFQWGADAYHGHLGTRRRGVPRAKDLGSRITSNVAENLTGVVVLVDTQARPPASP